jgi:hypothetical protein
MHAALLRIYVPSKGRILSANARDAKEIDETPALGILPVDLTLRVLSHTMPHVIVLYFAEV